ncbi:hypothetical protein CP969_13900 [Streptomyces viridosporus T7A]|uniref:Uncharacterized protein n=1 Tax=Streptomyces viridosporus T7A TaxID=665577 RepID=A0ABX6AEL0_STRVD|nr:hypothetical protein CP969_13900 [Streptomyces viridosporus T7A]
MLVRLRSRVGSIRSFHGPTGDDLGRVWAAERPAASVRGCVSCPLSARHLFKKSTVRIRAAPVRPRTRT